MRSQAVLTIRAGVLLAVLGAGLVGCASPWKQSFEPAASAGVYEPTERAVIRRVPWDRLASVLETIESQRAGSDVHPDDWTPEQRAGEHATLVSALQLSEAPEDLEILGRSVFRSTRSVKVLDGSLSDFARSLGADYAIWSTTYLGKAERVEREPVTRTGWVYGRYRRRDGYTDYDYLPYHETLYTPVVVERDEYAWLVYYARVIGDG
jgi:hypothetical protein